MNQNLTIRFRCGINTCTCRVVELRVYKAEGVCHSHVVLASGLTPRDIIATTQTYCDHPDVWLGSRLWEKREERAEKIPTTAPGGRGRSSPISSLGRREASVERKESSSLGVRASSYLVQEHRYWEDFNIQRGQTRKTIRNISPAERNKRLRWDSFYLTLAIWDYAKHTKLGKVNPALKLTWVE